MSELQENYVPDCQSSDCLRSVQSLSGLKQVRKTFSFGTQHSLHSILNRPFRNESKSNDNFIHLVEFLKVHNDNRTSTTREGYEHTGRCRSKIWKATLSRSQLPENDNLSRSKIFLSNWQYPVLEFFQTKLYPAKEICKKSIEIVEILPSKRSESYLQRANGLKRPFGVKNDKCGPRHGADFLQKWYHPPGVGILKMIYMSPAPPQENNVTQIEKPKGSSAA